MPDDILERLFGQLATLELPVPGPASVVSRGRQRRRRIRGLAASAVVAVVAVAVGASQLVGSLERAQPAAANGKPVSALCPAAPDAALTLDLLRELPISHQSGVSPIALSPDGTAVYLETTTQGFHGIAEESVATGAIITRIEPLAAKYGGAQGGLGPDGDLIWTNSYSTHGGETEAMTPVYRWSPRTGRITMLEPAGQHGDAISAPVFLNNTIAAWEQTDGRQQEIVEANLTTGNAVEVASGYLGPPVFVGNALVWPAASHANGAASHLVARNAALFPARQQIAVPLQLRAAGQASLIASNGMDTAYISANLTELWYSASPSRPARMVLRLSGGNVFAAGVPALGHGFLGWTDSNASYLASTKSFAVARITTFGSEYGAGGYVVVMGWSGKKTQPAQNPFHLFSASVIAGLKCAAAG